MLKFEQLKNENFRFAQRLENAKAGWNWNCIQQDAKQQVKLSNMISKAHMHIPAETSYGVFAKVSQMRS